MKVWSEEGAGAFLRVSKRYCRNRRDSKARDGKAVGVQVWYHRVVLVQTCIFVVIATPVFVWNGMPPHGRAMEVFVDGEVKNFFHL